MKSEIYSQGNGWDSNGAMNLSFSQFISNSVRGNFSLLQTEIEIMHKTCSILKIFIPVVEDIKDNLKLINNTHIFEPNILEEPFAVPSGWYLICDWLKHQVQLGRR